MCRTGCETQDHSSFGECCRAANLALHGFGDSGHANKAHDQELADYREARAQGIQPKSTRSEDTAFAVAASNAVDRPWNARENRFD
jgi:hypothetical protein